VAQKVICFIIALTLSAAKQLSKFLVDIRLDSSRAIW